MKKITLHGMAPDNAGHYHQAGTTLTVDDEGGKGCITVDRAAHLVELNSAAIADKEPAAKASD